MKVLLYVGKDLLGGKGGTERVMCNFANALNAQGHTVVVMTNSKDNGSVPVALGSAIKLINLGGKKFGIVRRSIDKFLASTSITRWFLKTFPQLDQLQAISNQVHQALLAEDPDILIAALPSDILELGYRQHHYHFPIVLMLHNEPDFIFQRHSRRIFRETIKAVQKHVNLLQVLMPEYLHTAKKYYTGEMVQIYNTVQQLPKNSVVDYSNNKEIFKIIYVGRLTEVKRQDVLIKAFAGLQKEFPQWQVHLWGEGNAEYTAYLQKLIVQLHLQQCVFLKGFTSNITAELLQADVCAFPSEVEGFSLALGEAMSAGLPCLGFQSTIGVSQLINDDATGLLCQDEIQDFQDKLKLLMSDANLRKRLGTAARQQMTRYAPEIIWQQWEDTIQKTVQEFGEKYLTPKNNGNIH